MAGTGLLTDRYELSMAAAYVAEGLAERPATFSLFVRSLPPTRGFLVAAGLDEALTRLEELRYTDDDLSRLESLGGLPPALLERLARLRFTGSVRAVPEGTVAFAGEPLLEVTGPLVEAQLVETILLNVLTTATTLASKAARYRQAAAGRPVVDFAFRRAQGVDAAMALVRAGALCGLAATSNVAGALRHGVPASGTMAHSYVQVHAREAEAFEAYARLFGDDAVLLVDTYDTGVGVERAIEVLGRLAGEGIRPRAIRLDSGDLAALAFDARRRLDEEGLGGVQVLASGGLDEHRVADLVAAGAPIDGFGVGSDLGVSADAPVLDTVYKLVAFDGRPVRKRSTGKATWPGAKQVWRREGWAGDVLALAAEPGPADGAEPLLVEVMANGTRTAAGRATLAEGRARFEAQWASLPVATRRLVDPRSVPVEASAALTTLTADLDGDGS